MTMKILSLFILLTGAIHLHAEEEPATPATTSAESDEITGIDYIAHKSGRGLIRPVTGYIFRKMGEPGFYLSKFLNYRRQLNKPRCTTSEKLNFYSGMVAITGDVVTHAYHFYKSKKLKDEYDQKLKQIENYVEQRIEDDQDIFERGKPEEFNVQIDAFQYFADQRKVELQRLELLRAFKYPAIALSSAATVINIIEITQENTIGAGSLQAKYEACMNAQEADSRAKKEEARALTEVNDQIDEAKGLKSDRYTRNQKKINEWTAPWFLKPFGWMLSGLNKADAWYRGNLRSLDQGMNTHDYATSEDGQAVMQEQRLNGITGKNLLAIQGEAQAIGYAEDMIVDLVMDAIYQWQNKEPPEVRERLNQQMKKEDKGKNPFMSIITKLGLDEIAVRFGVRKIIMAQAESVRGVMKSGVGRGLVIGYNIYVTHREISRMEKQIQYTKEEIRYLEQQKADLEKSLSGNFSKEDKEFITFVFQRVFKRLMLIESAYAVPAKQPSFAPLGPICLNLDNQSNFKCPSKNSLNPLDNAYFKSMSEADKKLHLDFLKDSYALESINALSRGVIPVQQLNIDKLKQEYNRTEKIYASMVEQLPKEQQEQLRKQKQFNENFDRMALVLPEPVMAHYLENYQNKNDQSNILKTIKILPVEKTTIPKQQQLIVSNDRPKPTYDNTEVIEHVDYHFKTYHSKSKSIWSIISNRYQKKIFD